MTASWYHIIITMTRDNTYTQTYAAGHNTLQQVMADFQAVTAMSEVLSADLLSSSYQSPSSAPPGSNMLLHRWDRPARRRWRPW